ncbi:MAG: OmpA family protein, partial [Pseudomonadota bacterium]|nr:OmpA family protein [Pseudomonadota bacterium]
AASAVKLLVKGGVDASRLSAVGYGEHQPVADNATPEGRAKNRRVVLMIARERVERPNIGSAEELDRAVNPVEVTVESPYPEPGEGQAPISETAATALTDTLDDLNPDSEEPQDRLAPIGEIKPVETKQGGLLFSSDPELQRN